VYDLGRISGLGFMVEGFEPLTPFA
jgi:hypothetical protein